MLQSCSLSQDRKNLLRRSRNSFFLQVLNLSQELTHSSTDLFPRNKFFVILQFLGKFLCDFLDGEVLQILIALYGPQNPTSSHRCVYKFSAIIFLAQQCNPSAPSLPHLHSQSSVREGHLFLTATAGPRGGDFAIALLHNSIPHPHQLLESALVVSASLPA